MSSDPPDEERCWWRSSRLCSLWLSLHSCPAGQGSRIVYIILWVLVSLVNIQRVTRFWNSTYHIGNFSEMLDTTSTEYILLWEAYHVLISFKERVFEVVRASQDRRSWGDGINTGRCISVGHSGGGNNTEAWVGEAKRLIRFKASLAKLPVI